MKTLLRIKVVNMNNALKHMYVLIKSFVGKELDTKIVWE